jgi:hypothetical protein
VAGPALSASDHLGHSMGGAAMNPESASPSG